MLILAGLICLLALPASLPVGPAMALVALFCIPSAASIPPGLRRAALAAGATPLRAWRDAVLAQIWLPAVLGSVAAWLRQ